VKLGFAGSNEMNKSIRIIGVLLLIAALTYQTLSAYRENRRQAQEARTTAALLGAELQDALRAPADRVIADLNRLYENHPDGNRIFDFLKTAKDRGDIYGGFVEVHPRELMDPKDWDSPEANAWYSMTLSTGSNLPLPSEEDLDFFRNTLKNNLVLRDTLNPERYLLGPQDESVVWWVRPVPDSPDTNIRMIGLGFKVKKELDPASQAGLEERFPRSPIYRLTASSGDRFAFTLTAPGGAVSYNLGDVKGKSGVWEKELDETALNFKGWTVLVRARDGGKPFNAVLPAVAGLAGIVLLLL
jgi:hypothetical protein